MINTLLESLKDIVGLEDVVDFLKSVVTGLSEVLICVLTALLGGRSPVTSQSPPGDGLLDGLISIDCGCNGPNGPNPNNCTACERAQLYFNLALTAAKNYSRCEEILKKCLQDLNIGTCTVCYSSFLF